MNSERLTRRSRQALATALLAMTAICIAAALRGCARAPERPMPPDTAKNVLIVLIDTLRADKLGCYGSALGLTPNIDRVAESGFVFEQAFSHAPWTLPATASLLSSWLPEEHQAGGRIGSTTAISKSTPLLTECLHEQGYDTGAIINVPFLKPGYGLNRGFDYYDYHQPTKGQTKQRVATEVTDLALKWIRGRSDSKRPFFMLAHYFDPHLTYDPPEEFRRRFALPEDHSPDTTIFGNVGDMYDLRNGRIDLASLPMKRLEALYNAEVAYTDQEVGRLLRELDALGLRDSTIVVITSDHGEEFLDHGGFEHGHTHYDELLRIPLIFYNPVEIARGRSTTVVPHLDVTPTLCALAGVRADARFRGQSLAAHFEKQPAEDRDILAQQNLWGGGAQMKSLRRDGYKLIDKKGDDELYHVAADPKERNNLAAAAGELSRVRAMSAAIDGMLQAVRDRLSGAAPQVVIQSEADRQAAAGLGYVAVDEQNKPAGSPEQPKPPPEGGREKPATSTGGGKSDS